MAYNNNADIDYNYVKEFIDSLRICVVESDSEDETLVTNQKGSGFGDYLRCHKIRINGSSQSQYERTGSLGRINFNPFQRVTTDGSNSNEIRRKQKISFEERIKREGYVGQTLAVSAVQSIIYRKQNGFTRPEKPIVFLFLGSSGTGKTELSKIIAKHFHKSIDKKGFIRFDMTEFQSKHEVSKFIGSPPGYTGYAEGGQLTEALKSCPNAVVLFDEVEKADEDVLNILLPVFDEGRLTDGKGNTIECKDAIFIMTSNLGSDQIKEFCASNSTEVSETQITDEFKEKTIRPLLKKHFKRDEFLGRINQILYFLPFSRSVLIQFIVNELNYWKNRLERVHKIKLTWHNNIIDFYANKYNIHYGARSLKDELENTVMHEIGIAHKDKRLNSGDEVNITFTEDSEQTDSSISHNPRIGPKLRLHINKSF